MKYCEDQNGTIIYACAVQERRDGAQINPTFFFFLKKKEIPLNGKAHIHVAHTQPFQL